jgi:MoxR-like ATPase
MFECLNAALYVAIQCGITGIAWGTTGVGKSATLEALAAALGRKFFCFIPSMHMPEDIGGIPHINLSKMVSEMVPMAWIRALTEPGWFLMIDEVTTAPQQMRPVLLSVMNEGRIGDLHFHPDTIIVAAANPPEIAPNGAPLEPSMLNRMYHHKWQTPFDTWYDGMLRGGVFKSPDNLPIVGDYSAYATKWCSIIARLTKAHPEMRQTDRIPDDQLAFPSPRAWHALALCLAGTEKVGLSDSNVPMELATGIVGADAADILANYIAASDLYDPDEVIKKPSIVKYDEDRIDQLIYLPISLMDALSKDASKPRIDGALEALVSMAENGFVENAAPVIGEIQKVYPKYKTPPKLATRYGKIACQIGGAA